MQSETEYRNRTGIRAWEEAFSERINKEMIVQQQWKLFHVNSAGSTGTLPEASGNAQTVARVVFQSAKQTKSRTDRLPEDQLPAFLKYVYRQFS